MQKNDSGLLKISIWAIKQSYKLAPISYLLIVLTSIFEALIPILYNFIFARFVDSLTIKNQEAIVYSILSLVGVYLIQAINSGLNKSKRREFKNYIKYKFNNLVSLNITKLRPDVLETPKMQDMILNASENSDRLSDFTYILLDIIKSFSSVIALFLIIFQINPALAFILIIVATPGSIKEFFITKEYWKVYKQNLNSKYIYKKIHESLGYTRYFIPNILVNSFDYSIKKLYYHAKILLDGEIKIIRKDYYLSIMSNVLLALAQLSLPLFFIKNILNGVWSVGDYTFRMSSLINYVESVETFLGNIGNLFDNTISLKFVYDFFKEADKVKSDFLACEKVVLDKNPEESLDISIKNLSFAYPNSKNKVLKDISLNIPAGKKVAIVGENGSGKTTLLYILLGVYTGYEGKVFIGSEELKNIKKEEYWKSLSIMSQDFSSFYAFDIKTNIAIGNDNLIKQVEDGNLTGIKAALKKAKADGFVEKLPDKYNSMLMKKFRNGTSLSGGQWQKLALARFFARDEARMYILDEPTSSLDIESEKEIFDEVFNMINNKTVIIVSHKFSTIKKADYIYVLDRGSVLEEGTHVDLMRKKGKYAKMYNLQVEWFS